MIHHRTFWMTASADALKVRKASACLPTLRAATPMAMAITRIWSTLKLTAVLTVVAALALSVTVELAPSPRKFLGNRPIRKAHQSPVLPVYLASSVIPVAAPGCRRTPSPMPISTETSEVMANQSSVFHASRAALET
ncbi:hypothetical protein D3C73_1291050 [compost metagenome]